MRARRQPVGPGPKDYRNGAIGVVALGLLLWRVANESAQIAGALALTATSYLLLTLYDSFALHVLGKKLPWRAAALARSTSSVNRLRTTSVVTTPR